MATTLPPKDYCVDCTSGYQQRMLDVGRCSHPEVRFYDVTSVQNGEILEIEQQGFREPPASNSRRIIQEVSID